MSSPRTQRSTRPADDALLSYLRQSVVMRLSRGKGLPEGYGYSCLEDFVLDRGELFKPQELDPEELEVVLKAVGHRNPQQRECFYNAQMLAIYGDSSMFEYHEGYALCQLPFPVLHGWATINGKVIDLTWRREDAEPCERFSDRFLGTFEPQMAYLGVHFDSAMLLESIASTGEAGSLIDRWKEGWPALKQPRLRPILPEIRALAERLASATEYCSSTESDTSSAGQ